MPLIDPTMLKFGARYRPGSIPLKLSDYLKAPLLPTVPLTFGHVTDPAIGGNWGMLGNDQAGDCVIAGFSHEELVFASATGKPLPVFTTANAFANYSLALVAEGGMPYDANDPSTDTGLDVTMAAEWRQSTGLTDANGHNMKVDSWVSVDYDHLALAAYMGGVCGLALNVPASATTEFSNGEPWSDTSGAPVGGHYVPLVGRNSKGNFMVITWGALQGVTPEFLQKYLMTGIAYVSEDYLLATGKTPEALDFATLRADTAALATPA